MYTVSYIQESVQSELDNGEKVWKSASMLTLPDKYISMDEVLAAIQHHASIEQSISSTCSCEFFHSDTSIKALYCIKAPDGSRYSIKLVTYYIDKL